MIRSQAAVRLLHSDPELTPEEALLLVVAPDAALRSASIAKAMERAQAARERGCRRCGTVVDEEGACAMCGAVSLDAHSALVSA